MAITLLTAPASYLLTTLDRVKAELNITDTSQDDVLSDIITRASSAITRECYGKGRLGFGVVTVQETLKGTGSQLLGLTAIPILSVTQVLQDTEVLDPSDPQDGYSIEEEESGALYRAAGWGQTVAMLSWGWEAYSSRYIPPGGTQMLRYTVTYTAGYRLPGIDEYLIYDSVAGLTLDTAKPPTVANVPPVLNKPAAMADPPPLPGDIEQACLMTVKAWYLTRGRDPSVTSQQSADLKISYDLSAVQSEALPSGALRLLRDYRRVA